MPFAEDQHPVGDLGPGGEHEPFRVAFARGLRDGIFTAWRTVPRVTSRCARSLPGRSRTSTAITARYTGKIVAVGVQAKQMIGRTPGSIVAVRPLKDGVIADFDVTERMLRYFIQKVHRRRHLARPRLVVAVPSGITGVEQSAVKEAGRQAGARGV